MELGFFIFVFIQDSKKYCIDSDFVYHGLKGSRFNRYLYAYLGMVDAYNLM
uniref:Uncharacterized protein n=1 Tax=Rhizophora mucronata TaxID=61149 RepID=A0A2P2MBS4_RHIMU